ncbi:MAG: DEAD/DEAH box helicase [Myxococcales bacterium]|nr:DEAD/DEAH box helicase [Myxococcales bacterium]
MGGAAEAADPELEAFGVLAAEAARHSTGVPGGVLARQALAVTVGTDFGVASDALEALVSRAKAAKRDELRIVTRPRGGGRGQYRVGRRGSERRPYDVWLEAVSPPMGSCACADYGKSGLGLCKHLFAVVQAELPRLAKGRGRGGAAKSATAPTAAATATAPAATASTVGPWLGWEPVRPFTGVGDWLERVVWRAPRSAPRGVASARAAALFAPPTAPTADRRLRRLRPDDPMARREIVSTLLAAIDKGPAGCAEPALVPLLQAERDRLAQSERAVRPRDLLRHLRSLKQRLFAYQLEGVSRFLTDGRLLLADDMGLGKTAQAIAACHVLVAAGRVERGLIIVPAALKAQWAREWQLFTDLPLTVVDGSAADRARIYQRRGGGILLTNYEQVLRDLPLMQRYAPEVIVLDEAQRIKNWAAKTSAYVKQLAAPWRLVLTGTPMENRLGELSSILDWVDETALEPRWRLTSWHAVRGDGRREVVGARNLDTLRARLRPCLLRRLRSEVLGQLPSRQDTAVAVPLTAAQRAAHDDLDLPIARLAASAQRRPLTQPEFLRLMSLLTQQRIICNGLAQRDFEEVWPTLADARRPSAAMLERLASPKLLELRERIAALAVDQGRKVVVFSQWRRMLKLAHWAVGDVLGDAGVRAVFFTGDESQRRRTQNLVDFHDDPSARVLFATDAGGVGLNLQRAASCVINLDLPWNPAVLEQRIGRVHRFGQAQPVDVYALVADGGIEARIVGLVGDKKALFRGVFDGTSDVVDFAQAGTFLDRVERLVERPVVDAVALGDSSDGADDTAVELASSDGPSDTLGPVTAEPVVAVGVPALDGGAAAVGASDAATLQRLLGQISIRPLADGRVAVEAPPAVAASVATLLRGLAGLLDAQAARPPAG